jgi:hypothetical protein
MKPRRETVDQAIDRRVAELLAAAPPIADWQRERAVQLLANAPADMPSRLRPGRRSARAAADSSEAA